MSKSITALGWLAIAIGFAGLLDTLFFYGHIAHESLIGIALACFASFASGGAVICRKRWSAVAVGSCGFLWLLSASSYIVHLLSLRPLVTYIDLIQGYQMEYFAIALFAPLVLGPSIAALTFLLVTSRPNRHEFSLEKTSSESPCR